MSAHKLPKPIHYTAEEGGVWIKWSKNWRSRPQLANCIVFDNGRAFDMLSGWRDARKFKYNKKTGELIR